MKKARELGALAFWLLLLGAIVLAALIARVDAQTPTPITSTPTPIQTPAPAYDPAQGWLGPAPAPYQVLRFGQDMYGNRFGVFGPQVPNGTTLPWGDGKGANFFIDTDATGTPIYYYNGTWIKDALPTVDYPDHSHCVSNGNPVACCTGPSAGTCSILPTTCTLGPPTTDYFFVKTGAKGHKLAICADSTPGSALYVYTDSKFLSTDKVISTDLDDNQLFGGNASWDFSGAGQVILPAGSTPPETRAAVVLSTTDKVFRVGRYTSGTDGRCSYTYGTACDDNGDCPTGESCVRNQAVIDNVTNYLTQRLPRVVSYHYTGSHCTGNNTPAATGDDAASCCNEDQWDGSSALCAGQDVATGTTYVAVKWQTKHGPTDFSGGSDPLVFKGMDTHGLRASNTTVDFPSTTFNGLWQVSCAVQMQNPNTVCTGSSAPVACCSGANTGTCTSGQVQVQIYDSTNTLEVASTTCPIFGTSTSDATSITSCVLSQILALRNTPFANATLQCRVRQTSPVTLKILGPASEFYSASSSFIMTRISEFKDGYE